MANLSADQALQDAGLYIDELQKIRILDPQTSQISVEIRDSANDFADKMAEFQKLIHFFEELLSNAAKQVDVEKMKAIAARNLVSSIAKERISEEEQLRSLIAEKRMHIERLRTQLESLQRLENEQNDFIEQFSMQK